MNQTFNHTRTEPEEDLLQCPYDPVHRILPKRMQTHLLKCRRAILGQPTSPYYQRALNMDVCKFNSKHHVQKDALDAHHNNCPDKKEYFSNVTQVTSSDDPDKLPGWMKLVDDSVLKKQPAGDEETWEDEWQETYDPMEKINSNTDIIYNPQGLSKAKKRDYAYNRRLQAEGVLTEATNSFCKDEENWGEEDWNTNEWSSTRNNTDAQKTNSKSNENVNAWSQKQNNTKSKTNNKGRKVETNRNQHTSDGWTEVAPRFRKDKYKNNGNGFVQENNESWGWDNNPTPTAIKSNIGRNSFDQKTNTQDGWGSESRPTPSNSSSYQKVQLDEQAWNKNDSWGKEIGFASSIISHDVPTAPISNDYSNDDDGGWGKETLSSINPYLNQHQSIEKVVEDDEGWEGEEYTPEPYIDPWGTVIGTDPDEIASKLSVEQKKLEEEKTCETWGGSTIDVAPVSLGTSNTAPKHKKGDRKSEGSGPKLSGNARAFAPPEFPPHSKLTRNAMEFTPPGYPSETGNNSKLPVLTSNAELPKENISSTTSILTTDTDTPASVLTENDSEMEQNKKPPAPPPGFPQAAPSESGSSEVSFNPAGDNKCEPGENTFSHEDRNKKVGGKKVNVELEDNAKKTSVDIPAQQNSKLHHRSNSAKARKRSGGRKKREKNHDKNKTDRITNISKIASTSMAVKCLALAIVIGLFISLYFVIVIVLLSLKTDM